MKLYPLQFKPLLRQYIWGGRRLGEVLGKSLPAEGTFAESWEVVDHGHDQSVVVSGPLAGATLSQLIRDHNTALLGRQAGLTQFPLLLKYLDCNRVLSVQVHPDDGYAARMQPPDLGKTEAWYIVDAAPGSVIYAGLQPGVDRRQLQAGLDQGQVEPLLHRFEPRPGDCVFIPAGTVHALGAGLLVAEIQQASDTTFRLFDWNRLDDRGEPRTLHVQQALEVTDYGRGPVHPQSPEPLGGGWDRLVTCDRFVLRRFAGSGTALLDAADQCWIVTVPHGAAVLRGGAHRIAMPRGATVLIPAAVGEVRIEPTAAGTTVLAMGIGGMGMGNEGMGE